MKSSKIWKIIWVSGIYLILILILYLIIIYKVKWEDKDLNTYLYFYKCGNQLCSSTTKQNIYYNKIICENGVCPFITDIHNNNIILKDNRKTWVYNYISNEIINDKYYSYKYINDNMIIVSDISNNYGIIDRVGNVLIDFNYSYIDDYKNGYVTYIENELFGIENKEIDYTLEPLYEDIVLINDKIFAGRLDNVYQLHTYDNLSDDNNNKYNYVYSYDNIILVANNNKIDILDSNLNSTLLMKIDSYYSYTTEEERESLNISTDGINIYFDVLINETEYTKYIYNIKSKKIM